MGGARIGGARLPFEIDQELEDFVVQGQGEEKKDVLNERQAFLFPAYGRRGGVPRAPAVSEREHRRVNLRREILAQFQAGPFFTGPAGSLKEVCAAGTKRAAADFDAFGDQATWAKKFERPTFRLRNLKKHKFADPYGLMPRELWAELGIAEDPNDPRMREKKVVVVAASKKRKLDRLARAVQARILYICGNKICRNDVDTFTSIWRKGGERVETRSVVPPSRDFNCLIVGHNNDKHWAPLLPVSILSLAAQTPS
nr:hypothetical protein CFP56_63022 [Quercus suber]